MESATTATGTCLCGKITLSFEPKKNTFFACHCNMCRKWKGGPNLAIEGGTEISFKGREHITIYNSSEWAERGFCKCCGSHLFYRLKSTNSYNLPLGILDNIDDLKFNMQIFIDDKPHNYSFAEKTDSMTEAQVLSLYT